MNPRKPLPSFGASLTAKPPPALIVHPRLNWSPSFPNDQTAPPPAFTVQLWSGGSSTGASCAWQLKAISINKVTQRTLQRSISRFVINDLSILGLLFRLRINLIGN